ncbi:MAG TPA: RHS repeat-associated core domain-containing protein, partial [Thermoanaerobaculia bacterium]|nr:RHS repeat-associated core domain-containing protein [Thermoanaerobaculia bacterium]
VEYEPYGYVATYRTGSIDDQPLRLPGQEQYNRGKPGDYYNIFRWYTAGWSRYTQADPIGLKGSSNLYSYALANPIVLSDPLGLMVRTCCKTIPGTLGHRHCYFEFNDGPNRTIGYHFDGQENFLNIPWAAACLAVARIQKDHGFDNDGKRTAGECGPWAPCSQCVRDQADRYGARQYCLFGPNSNTFASGIGKVCNVPLPPPAMLADSPGWQRFMDNYVPQEERRRKYGSWW